MTNDACIIVESDTATCYLDNGAEIPQTQQIPVAELLDTIHCGINPIVYPPGVRYVTQDSLGSYIMVHEMEPRIVNINWGSNGRKTADGRETYHYRKVRLAMPYVWTIFKCLGENVDTSTMGIYFSNEPLADIGQPLHHPCLPNIRRPSSDYGYFNRVCLGSSHYNPYNTLDRNIRHLIQNFWETSFNQSFELAGYESCWQAYQNRVDLPTVEDWEKLTAQHPDDILRKPWAETSHTIRDVLSRMGAFKELKGDYIRRFILNWGLRTNACFSTPSISDTLVTRANQATDKIARRAYEISQSPESGSNVENWLRAERELYGRPTNG